MLSGTAPMALLHPAASVHQVYGFAPNGRRIDYSRGADWDADARTVWRTETSRIPDYAGYRYRAVDGGGRFSFAPSPRNPPHSARYNVYVDYAARVPDPLVRARPLPRPARKILCLGDSINGGADTVAATAFQSRQESWCGLLRRYLTGRAHVVINATPDSTLRGVWEQLPNYVAWDPDTVIVAFGMNDHVIGGTNLATFSRQIDSVLGRLTAAHRNALAVGFFQQNPLFDREDPQRTRAFNAAIREAANRHGVPFIDPYAAFDRARPGPNQFFHLTADFMHHPNSYGQRIYFSLLVPYFLERDTRASEIPGYVVGDW